MKAIVSHETALRYWRYHFPEDGELGKPARVSHAGTYAVNSEDVLACIPESYLDDEKTIDVLVMSKASRRHAKSITHHTWETPLPPNAFYSAQSTLVSSPEFVFLQMANTLPTAQLVALGCELCGFYILQPGKTRDMQKLDVPPKRLTPLTNVQKLEEFLDACGSPRGIKAARRALKYVVEASRSPMETAVYLQLCLPPLLGGYGLPKPEMNATIDLDEEASTIARRRWCEGDICWSDDKLDIEYHGEVHVGAEPMKDDVGRILGIEHMGWRVITVTSPQVFDIQKFEVAAKEAAKRVKHRLYAHVLGCTPARQTLHEQLESWMGLA